MLRHEPPKALARVLVLSVWSVTPLSWVYVLLYIILHASYSTSVNDAFRHVVRGTLPATARKPTWLTRFLSSRGLFFYSVVEVLFSLYYRRLAARIQPPAVAHSASRDYVIKAIVAALNDGMDLDGTDKQGIIEMDHIPTELPHATRQLDYNDPRAVEFRQDMSGWFIGLNPTQITKQDLRDWMSWALFGKFYEQILAEDQSTEKSNGNAHRQLDFMDKAIRLFSARSGVSEYPDTIELSPKEQRKKHTMLLSLDPVRVSTRPLALYVLMYLLNELAIFVWNRRYGMERLTVGSVQYLYYQPPEWNAEAAQRGEAPLPILFLHGLGIGIVEYVDVVRALMNPLLSPRPRPVLIPLQPWTSGDLFSPRFLRPWHKSESARLIRSMLKRHGLDRCGVSVLSHSMGTILHTWLLKEMPDQLRRSLLVDPVCFQLWAPHVCYRFLYKKAHTFVEYMLRYFVARELATANVLMRNFDWSANVLYAENIPNRSNPNRTRIYLAGADTVLDADIVVRYLRRNGMGNVIEYQQDVHHGAFVMGPLNSLPKIVSELDAPLK